MKTVKLSGSPRASVGKVNSKELRAKGHVPCVIYGGKEQIHFHADERAFKPIIFTPNAHIIEVDVEGKTYKTVLQEAQYHKINDKLIHVDFLEIIDGKPVTANIPVVLTGQSEGVKKGGKLVLKQRKLKVRGIADKLPDAIEVSISNLDLGDSIAVGDINIDGVTLLNAKNVSVVAVNATRASAAANETPAKK
jgi:large subunit ribosomal protein L25